MLLLEAQDIDLARPWRWFDDKAILLVVALALSDHVDRHCHALNALDSPLVFLFFFFHFCVAILARFVIIINPLTDCAAKSTYTLFVAKEILGDDKVSF